MPCTHSHGTGHHGGEVSRSGTLSTSTHPGRGLNRQASRLPGNRAFLPSADILSCCSCVLLRRLPSFTSRLERSRTALRVVQPPMRSGGPRGWSRGSVRVSPAPLCERWRTEPARASAPAQCAMRHVAVLGSPACADTSFPLIAPLYGLSASR